MLRSAVSELIPVKGTAMLLSWQKYPRSKLRNRSSFFIGFRDLVLIVWSVRGFGLCLSSHHCSKFLKYKFCLFFKGTSGKKIFLTKLSERNLDPAKVNGSFATEFAETSIAP